MLKTPIVLDESIVTMSDLDAAIEAQACAGISVKSARLGGIGAAVEIHDRCLGAGLHLVIGGMYETGLGRSVAISLGALSGFDLAGELGASDRYFAPDLTLPHYLTNGELEVPREPGIGRRPDPAVLNAKVTKRKTLFAP